MIKWSLSFEITIILLNVLCMLKILATGLNDTRTKRNKWIPCPEIDTQSTGLRKQTCSHIMVIETYKVKLIKKRIIMEGGLLSLALSLPLFLLDKQSREQQIKLKLLIQQLLLPIPFSRP